MYLPAAHRFSPIVHRKSLFLVLLFIFCGTIALGQLTPQHANAEPQELLDQAKQMLIEGELQAADAMLAQASVLASNSSNVELILEVETMRARLRINAFRSAGQHLDFPALEHIALEPSQENAHKEQFVCYLFEVAQLESLVGSDAERRKALDRARTFVNAHQLELDKIFQLYGFQDSVHLYGVGLWKYDQAMMLLDKGKDKEALEKHKESVAYFRQSDGFKFFAYSCVSLIDEIYDRFGENKSYQEALFLLKDSVWREPLYKGEFSLFGKAEVRIGDWYESTEELLKSIDAYKLAEEYILKDSCCSDYLGRYVYRNLGTNLDLVGDFELSKYYLEKALKNISPEGSQAPINYAYVSLAKVLRGQGKYEEARDTVLQGLKRKGIHPFAEAMLKANLADNWYVQRELAGSRNTLMEALNYFDANGQKDYSFAMRRLLGLIEQEEGNLDEASRQFLVAEKILDDLGGNQGRNTADLENAKGNLAIEAGNYRTAIDAYNHAIGELIPGAELSAPFENPDSNSIYAEPYLANALQGKTLASILLALDEDGETAQGLFQAAFQSFRLAQQVEKALLDTYIGEHSGFIRREIAHAETEALLEAIYQLYTKTPQTGHIDMALALIETGKAILMQESMGQNATITEASPFYEEAQRSKRESYYYAREMERAILDGNRARASEYEAQMLDARSTYKEYLEQEYNASQPEFSKWVNGIPIKELQQNLEDDQSIIAFYEGQQNLYTILITPEELDFIQSPLTESYGQDIEQMIGLFTRFTTGGELMNRNNLKLFAETSHALYQQIWAPLVQDNRKLSQRLVIVPDGKMQQISFDLLIREFPDQLDDLREFPYLINTHTFSTQYSIGLWKQLEEEKSQLFTFPYLGIAPGFEQSEAHASLPYSKLELLNNWWTKTLTAAKANKDAFERWAKDYKIIHISSHAYADEDRPLDAYVAFYDVPGESLNDSKLTLADIYSLRLKAEMIVLSACETASGKLLQGEGRISLARGFTMAGSKSVLSTQWQVNHRSHVELIKGFFNHLTDGMKKDEALRAAKLDYLSNSKKDQAHPFFWAASSINGDLHHIQIIPSYIFWLVGFLISMGLIAGIYFLVSKKVDSLNT